MQQQQQQQPLAQQYSVPQPHQHQHQQAQAQAQPLVQPQPTPPLQYYASPAFQQPLYSAPTRQPTPQYGGPQQQQQQQQQAALLSSSIPGSGGIPGLGFISSLFSQGPDTNTASSAPATGGAGSSASSYSYAAATRGPMGPLGTPATATTSTTTTTAGAGGGISETAVPTRIQVDWRVAFTSGGFDGEPPLLEELGFNFAHIRSKTFAVLNPLRPMGDNVNMLTEDADLTGPLLFCFLFGCVLLLAGKSHFPYIYGVAVLGCISMYALLNLMSDTAVDCATTASVLGYCLLPMVLLSVVAALVRLAGVLSFAVFAFAVLWCTYSASTMFVAALRMADQKPLIAYPIGLLYTIFGLMAIF